MMTLVPLALLVLAAVAGVARAQPTWTPLRAYVHTPALLEDYDRACYKSEHLSGGSARYFV